MVFERASKQRNWDRSRCVFGEFFEPCNACLILSLIPTLDRQLLQHNLSNHPTRKQPASAAWVSYLRSTWNFCVGYGVGPRWCSARRFSFSFEEELSPFKQPCNRVTRNRYVEDKECGSHASCLNGRKHDLELFSARNLHFKKKLVGREPFCWNHPFATRASLFFLSDDTDSIFRTSGFVPGRIVRGSFSLLWQLLLRPACGGWSLRALRCLAFLIAFQNFKLNE